MDEKHLQLVAAILTVGYAWDKQFDRVERLCDAYVEVMNQLRYLEQEMGRFIPNLRVTKVSWKEALLATPRPLKRD